MKYKVTASYVVYCHATIDAKDKDEARAIAERMDGGDFDIDNGDPCSDWQIVSITTTKETS
jgi:hypothetical protein